MRSTPKRIALTHTGPTAEHLTAQFRAAGLEAVHIPLIEFVPPDDAEAAAQVVEAHPPGQWLVITSPQGARALVGLITPAGRWPVAAVGEGTARELSRLGVPVAFQPSQADGRTLGRELPLEKGAGVLHLTSDHAGYDLKEGLTVRGVNYQRLVAYRTVPRKLSQSEVDDLRGCTLVTLASGTAAVALSAVVPSTMPVVSMGRQTTQAARQAGFQRVYQAELPSMDSLAQAVLKALEAHSDA